MAAAYQQNVESLTLSQSTDRLSTAIEPDVVRVAVKLFEKGLISREQLGEAQLQIKISYTRATELVRHVIGRVSFQPEAFRIFLDALKECDVFEGVAREVYQQYAENQDTRKRSGTFDDSDEWAINQREMESLQLLPSVIPERINSPSVDQMKHLHFHVSNKCAWSNKCLCLGFLAVAALIILYYIFPPVLHFFSTDSVYCGVPASPLVKWAHLLSLVYSLLYLVYTVKSADDLCEMDVTKFMLFSGLAQLCVTVILSGYFWIHVHIAGSFCYVLYGVHTLWVGLSCYLLLFFCCGPLLIELLLYLFPGV